DRDELEREADDEAGHGKPPPRKGPERIDPGPDDAEQRGRDQRKDAERGQVHAGLGSRGTATASSTRSSSARAECPSRMASGVIAMRCGTTHAAPRFTSSGTTNLPPRSAASMRAAR